MWPVKGAKLAGVDFLQLDPAHAGPHGLTAWLAEQLRAAIADGRLPLGARLPPTRVLAAELGVSRGVVTDAYQRLVDEGRILGRRGGGTTVTSIPTPKVRRGEPTRSVPTVASLDLSPGIPDLSAFPRAAWLRAERAVLNQATPRDLGYGDPAGTPALRASLAVWLARTRAVHAAADDVLIVNGVAQGLALVARVLQQHGIDAVATEDPGSLGTREQLANWGMATASVPVDEHGLNVDRLRAANVAAVLVTPAHQFPTGVVLGPQRRHELLAWSADGGLIIEDDYDAEHRYDRPPVAALQGLAPEQVIHTGSMSKTLAPALRIGWLITPERLRDQFIQAKRQADLASPALPQLALTRLIDSGDLERHLRLVRSRQRRRRDALAMALRTFLPSARVHGVAAGLHLLVTFEEDLDDQQLAAQLLDTGIKVHPLSWHRRLPGPPGLVLGYATATPEEITRAVQRIRAILDSTSHRRKTAVRPRSRR
jgi:GntR family transcriptional regulator / MocR family aminotransferase